jgi:hypothetical protein
VPDTRNTDPVLVALTGLDRRRERAVPRDRLIEVRDARDGMAHLIADADDPAICGRPILPASLVVETGPECPHCHTIVDARRIVLHQQTARAVRRRRWWRR